MIRPRYLLDTNTVSYIIRGKPPAVRARLKGIPFRQLAISAITEAELLYGVERETEAVRLNSLIQDFLFQVDSLAWDSNAARTYGMMRSELARGGRILGNHDMLITAQAIAENLILVSNDDAFRQVPRLSLEDWTKPLTE